MKSIRSASPTVVVSPSSRIRVPSSNRISTPVATPVGSAAQAPSGAALSALLSSGLAGLSSLGDTPFAAPLVGEEDDVVPIEDLIFRGREALDRAIQIGDALRQSGAVPDHATLTELYDLLQLAAAE